MMRTLPVKGLAAALTVSAALLTASLPAQAAPIQDYFALGDSVAFGETDFTHNPSNGDRGYVKHYDQFLGTLNGGVNPKVVNLAVDGETTSTFFGGGGTGDGTPGNPGYSLNTNYPAAATNQNALMLEKLSNRIAAGHVINTVSVQLGANDLFAVLNTPGFSALTPAQQQAQVFAALGTIQNNLTTLLSEVHSIAPHAHLVMNGYYDPYAAFPNSPVEKLSGVAIPALNSVISGEAAAFGGTYVDLSAAFAGHELALTLIGQGNVHPNKDGYQVIASQMDAAAVPEPSSLLVLGAGLSGWYALRRRRTLRRAA